MTSPELSGSSERAKHAVVSTDVYGEGFAAVYSSDRYALFSQRLAKLALSLIGRHGAPGRELLDLACGAGAGTVVFAKAGYAVTGIDRSTTMIDRSEQRARAAGLEVRLSEQDMQSFFLAYQVDVVTCLFDALNYLLQEEELARVFARVAAVVRPGGLFVFDMNTLHGLATRWGTRDLVSTARPDLVEVNQYRFHEESGMNTVTTTIFVRQAENDLFRRYTEVHRERGYPSEKIAALLQQAGLDIVSLHGLNDKFQGLIGGLRPLDDQAGRMIIVARRGDSTE